MAAEARDPSQQADIERSDTTDSFLALTTTPAVESGYATPRPASQEARHSSLPPAAQNSLGLSIWPNEMDQFVDWDSIQMNHEMMFTSQQSGENIHNLAWKSHTGFMYPDNLNPTHIAAQSSAHVNPASIALPNANHQSNRAAFHNQTQGPDSNFSHLFRCKWEGCRSTHHFRREGDLWRHIRSIHLAPNAFPCPVAGCDKVCGRKDHMQQHVKRHHALSRAGQLDV
ncbi:hypothetical protein BJX70DRAFT_363142 [Aspergillus crustosus]